jgi:ureidoacrylate peracid hydrolase
MVTFAIDPRKSAVVAIDLQNCNVEKSPIAAPLGLQVVDKLNFLTVHYRAAGSTIIWTRHAVRPDHSDVGILGGISHSPYPEPRSQGCAGRQAIRQYQRPS